MRMTANLNWESWVSVLKGAAIAAGGVFLTYLAEHMGDMDFGDYTVVVSGVLMVVINYARKLVAEIMAPDVPPQPPVASFMPLFLVGLLTVGWAAPVQAQTYATRTSLACWGSSTPRTDPALIAILQRMADRPALAPTDPALIAILTRISDQNQQLIAQNQQIMGLLAQRPPSSTLDQQLMSLLAQMQDALRQQQPDQQAQLMRLLSEMQETIRQQQARPTPQPQIIYLPQQQVPIAGVPHQQLYIGGSPQQQLPISGGPQQQLPIGGSPQQQLPISGAPQQHLPIGGQPQQQLPIGGQPQQQLPPGGAPQQQLPGGGQPQQQPPAGGQPQQQMPPAAGPQQQQLPTGYQRYQATVASRPVVVEELWDAAGMRGRWVDGKLTYRR